MCVHIFYIPVCRGVRAPTVDIWGNVEASELFSVREFDFSEADKIKHQRRCWFGSSAAYQSTALLRVTSVVLPEPYLKDK